MCGITGFFDLKNKVEVSTIQSMTDALKHRGPDDQAVFISPNEHFSLGHRRLSFLDLSDQGKQPMTDNSGYLTITFNGEIYNFLELKNELSDEYHFHTGTDTEVILAAYQKWGVDALSYLKGMFAFAILDESKQRLFLARDRFGIKPLYYSIQDSKILFSSELKAIHASKQIRMEIDFSSFADYFVYRYIPSPKTIWKDIKKLPPATFAMIDLDNLSCQLTEYWTLESNEKELAQEEITAEVNAIINKSISEHVRADVPIGSFLSGGYDSSALVAFMKKFKLQPETFSIGFSNWERSEEQFAEIVADHLGVSNDSVIATEQSLDWVEFMPEVYDEPIADISIVPTYLVSKLAHSKVKAVVSGEGADEIFGGYTWQLEFYRKHNPTNFLDKLKKLFSNNDTVSFYAKTMAMGWFDDNELRKMLHPRLHEFIPQDVHWFYRKHFDENLSPLKSIQKLDIKCFMGELVLTKIDRASMANSLEVRVPFLDHQLFEYIFGLKENNYFKSQQTKYLLFENIKNHLPKSILERKKQGFVGPDSYYMNKNWYKSQLKNSKLVELNLVNQAYIEELFNESYDWKLWKLVIMEKWVQKWI